MAAGLTGVAVNACNAPPPCRVADPDRGLHTAPNPHSCAARGRWSRSKTGTRSKREPSTDVRYVTYASAPSAAPCAGKAPRAGVSGFCGGLVRIRASPPTATPPAAPRPWPAPAPALAAAGNPSPALPVEFRPANRRQPRDLLRHRRQIGGRRRIGGGLPSLVRMWRKSASRSGPKCGAGVRASSTSTFGVMPTPWIDRPDGV